MESNKTISQQDFDMLRDYIRKECALEISDDKKYLIETRLGHLLEETGIKDFNEFCLKAKRDFTYGLRDRIVDAITTHETLWFRDKTIWSVIEKVILPNFAQQLVDGPAVRIRIWSAACSTGQETYSLAMLIDDWIAKNPQSGIKPEHFEILGTDVSPSAIKAAKKGQFSELEMSRGLDSAYIDKYFVKEGPNYLIDEKIKNRVAHRVFNLQDNFMGMRRMDLVLCRNVMIYFSQEFKDQLMRRLAVNMNPGAYFILGATESGYGHSHTFEMKNYENTIYYQLRTF